MSRSPSIAAAGLVIVTGMSLGAALEMVRVLCPGRCSLPGLWAELQEIWLGSASMRLSAEAWANAIALVGRNGIQV